MAQVSVRVKVRPNARLQDNVGDQWRKRGLRIVAQNVEREAKRLCPVKTGNLRRSISHEVGGRGKRVYAIVKATAHYASFVEYGTRFQNPQPYLRPALMRVMGKR